MTEFSAVSLRIETVGEREAMNALNDLDKRGRAIVEGVAAATGRAMGDIAAAYDSGSKRIRQQLQNIADDHYANIKAMQAEQDAARKALDDVAAAQEAAAAKAERSTVAVSRALETMARTGKEGGRSLDTVIAQLATGFGLGGPIVGAIGIATVAIVELFAKADRESKKLVDAMAKDFDRIAHMDTKGQGEAASLLYSGDPFGTTNETIASMAELRRQRADFTRRAAARDIVGGPGGVERRMTADAGEAAEALKKVNAELERRNTLLLSITGPGGSLTRAGTLQAQNDKPGFDTDAINEQAKAFEKWYALQQRQIKGMSLAGELSAAQVGWLKDESKEWEALAKAVGITNPKFERYLELRKSADALVKKNETESTIESRANAAMGLPEGANPRDALLGGLFAGFAPDPKILAAQIKQSVTVALQSLKNDPFVEAAKAAEELAVRLGSVIKRGLGDALVSSIDAGIRKAFDGSGASGFFAAFGRTMLSAFGGIMEQMGGALISYGIAMEMVSVAIKNPFTAGPAAIAAGALLVALGATLSAAAAGGGGGHTGSSYSSSAGLGSIIDRGVITPGSYSTSDARSIPIKPIVQVNATIFGTKDANAQRGFDEMMREAHRRGSLAGV